MLEGRVKFLSRLGRSSGAGLKVEGDAAAKANVWATLARTAANPVQQLSAYQKCLDCVNGRFERVEYLVELAEWLVAQRVSKGDAQTLRKRRRPAAGGRRKCTYPIGDADGLAVRLPHLRHHHEKDHDARGHRGRAPATRSVTDLEAERHVRPLRIKCRWC